MVSIGSVRQEQHLLDLGKRGVQSQDTGRETIAESH